MSVTSLAIRSQICTLFPVYCVHSACSSLATESPMRTKITKRQVDALLPGCIIADEEVKGFVARRMRSGAVTYGFRYRDKKTSKERWIAR